MNVSYKRLAVSASRLSFCVKLLFVLFIKIAPWFFGIVGDFIMLVELVVLRDWRSSALQWKRPCLPRNQEYSWRALKTGCLRENLGCDMSAKGKIWHPQYVGMSLSRCLCGVSILPLTGTYQDPLGGYCPLRHYQWNMNPIVSNHLG